MGRPGAPVSPLAVVCGHRLFRVFGALMQALFSLSSFSRAGPAPAIFDADGCTTYAQLADMIRTLRRDLASGGLAPGDLVAVPSSRKATTIALWIATLGCGGNIMPIDATLPRQRREA